MTRCDRDRESGPTTQAELEAALDDLVRAAHTNGVRIRGGFGLRHPAPDTPDWAIEFTRLRKSRIGEKGRERTR